jgi:hypothetical protein
MVRRDEEQRKIQRRYELDVNIRWKTQPANQTGSGKVIDISSNDISFVCVRALPLGLVLEASIDWPVLKNGTSPLLLEVKGRVIRSDKVETAISVERYKFRTPLRTPRETPKALG